MDAPMCYKNRQSVARGGRVHGQRPCIDAAGEITHALETHVRGAKPDLATIESSIGAISTGATAQLRGELSREAGAAPGATGRRSTGRRSARAENT